MNFVGGTWSARFSRIPLFAIRKIACNPTGITGTVGTMLVCEKLFTPPVLVLSLRQLESLPAQLRLSLAAMSWQKKGPACAGPIFFGILRSETGYCQHGKPRS